MTLNPYSALAAFVAALEAGLAVVVLALVAREVVRLRRARSAGGSGSRSPGEGPAPDSTPLVAWTGMVLVALGLLSWPLLFLLLESYVPFWWPRVMCIEGVCRIGEGTSGPAAALPGVVAALQWTKPALVFVAGAFVVLHLADRATRTAPRRGRVLASLALLGALAAADAGLELRYLSIEKREETPNTGGCNVVAAGHDAKDAAQPLPLVRFPSPGAARHGLTVAHLALGVLLAAGLLAWSRRARRTPAPPRLAPLLVLLAAVSVPVGIAFLVNVASPTLLHRPEHRCPYCVLADAPETGVAVALFLAGVLATGWAALAAYGARHPEAEGPLRRVVRALVLVGAFGSAGATLFSAVGLLVA